MQYPLCVPPLPPSVINTQRHALQSRQAPLAGRDLQMKKKIEGTASFSDADNLLIGFEFYQVVPI